MKSASSGTCTDSSRTFDGAFFGPFPYKGPPSPAVNEAWDKIVNSKSFYHRFHCTANCFRSLEDEFHPRGNDSHGQGPGLSSNTGRTWWCKSSLCAVISQRSSICIIYFVLTNAYARYRAISAFSKQRTTHTASTTSGNIATKTTSPMSQMQPENLATSTTSTSSTVSICYDRRSCAVLIQVS